MREVGFWRVALTPSPPGVDSRDEHGEECVPLLQQKVPVDGDRPDPTQLVDHRWVLANPHLLAMLEWYLLPGAFVESHELAFSFCRFQNCNAARKHPRVMGACTMTDGVYCWPEGYWHYIHHHHVRPPQSFLDHITANYRRALLASKALRRERGDDVLWMWDAERRRPMVMPSGMQEWVLEHTTLALPGQEKKAAPIEISYWDRLLARLPTWCCACWS